MLAQCLFVFRLIGSGLRHPSYIFKCLKDPLWFPVRLRNTMKYGCSRYDFVQRLVNTSNDRLEQMCGELESNRLFHEHLDRCWQELEEVQLGKMRPKINYDIPEMLYVLLRMMSPDIVVETGVFHGVSSAFILQALKDNNHGQLYSIDLPPAGYKIADGRTYLLPKGKESGWIVPEGLRSRWHLMLGKTSDKLQPMLRELGNIDCFLHDSLHTYENMKWEFETAWPFVRRVLIADNITENRAFFDFSRSVDSTKICIYADFGGIRKK